MQINIVIKILAISMLLFSVNISSAAGLEPPLKVAWKSRLGIASTDIGPQSIILIVSDIAFVDYGGLKAIDVNDGKLLWSKDWSARVVYKDGILYAAREMSPILYALDARTGAEIWKKEYPEIGVNALVYDLTFFNDTLYIMTKYSMGENFWVFAADINGKLKWHHKYRGRTNIEMHPLMSPNAIVILYDSSSPDFTVNKNHLIALNSTTGETVWEISNIPFYGKSFIYKDMLFVDGLRENDSYDNFFIQAISSVSGETIWKKKIGDSYGNILAVLDNKLIVNSDTIKVLDPRTGETLDEYSSTVDPESFGSISGLPGLLEYSPAVISDHILYVASTGPSPYIYSIDLNTGNLLWKGGKGGISPYIYENRLYLIVFGQLYAYEHGIEEKNEEAKFHFFSMLGVPLILINLFIKFKKYKERLYQSFQFSSILIIIVFLLILGSETLSNQYLNLMDERLIISTPPDWMLYLLFPAISVIAGTFAGMRFKNKFMISAASGLAPFILAIAVSFLFLSISDKIIFLFSMVPLFISIPIIILISLFYGVIGSIIGCVLKKINGASAYGFC